MCAGGADRRRLALLLTRVQFYATGPIQSWQHIGIALGLSGTLWLIDYVLNARFLRGDSAQRRRELAKLSQ